MYCDAIRSVVMMCIVHLPTMQNFLYLNLLGEQGGKIDSSRSLGASLPVYSFGSKVVRIEFLIEFYFNIWGSS